jgi:phosphatidylinositol 4-kinase
MTLKTTKQYSSNQRKRKTLAGGILQQEGAA